ncbi:MAG: hypothetical protein M1378_04090 [Bacteroidetes bacterium]|nr:hypothetical protein [Bacteroidota bacterium]
MKIAISVVLFASLFVGSPAQPGPASDILQKSEQRVRMLEQKAESLSGTMKTTVDFSSNVLGKKANGKSIYRVYVKDGLDVVNRLIGTPASSDSMVSEMMERESDRRLNKPILHIFDTAFPWERYLSSANKKQEFSAVVASDSDNISGRNCYRLSFNLEAEGDSVSASGKGEVWIDRKTLLPVRTWRDFTVDMKRGNAEVKTFSDFGSLQDGVPVLLRSEIQTIPKFLFESELSDGCRRIASTDNR